MRIAVVGSRDYPSLAQVRRYVEALPRDTVIVSGGARGVDITAEETAVACGLTTEIYLPDWQLGKKAGLLRNEKIVAACNHLTAFWDGQSSGTRHSIGLAKRAGKPYTVFSPGAAYV